jgi:hypothetical protein
MESTQSLGMGTPELLLQDLNSALRELLGAVSLLEDADELHAQMLPVMRRMLLAEVVGKESILAIGGSQGAGKTTLLNALYALKGKDALWLKANEGQGECMPVLILEERGRTQVQGAVRRLESMGTSFRVKEVYLELEEFQKAVRNPDPSDLLPVFRVPPRYFQRPDQAWLLLPGYESETRQNKEWQQLMRQALVAAVGCIIVTDETRLANRDQLDIVKDMMEKELRGAQTLVAISKTEGTRGRPDRQNALRETAQRVFGLTPERAARWVICTGVEDENYVSEWMPILSTRVEDLALSGGGNRQVQLKRLESVLAQDLAALLTRIRVKADLWFQQRENGQGGPREVVYACLEAFDDECNDLRADYQTAVGLMLDDQYGKGWDQLKGRLASEHEGLLNHAKDFFRKASESQQRIERAVSEAWKSPGPVLEAFAQVVGKLTRKKLEAREIPHTQLATQTPHLSKNSLAQRLGYVNGQELTQWARPDEDDQHHLRLIFGKKARQSDKADSTDREEKKDERVRVGFERSVKLLPALGLEFARVASVVPELVGVEGTALTPVELSQRPDLISNAMQNLGDGLNLGRTVLRGIAAVLAVDVVADGELDVPGVLSSVLGGAATKATAGGASAAGAVTGVGAAVVGLVAVGYLTYSAMQQSRQHDEKAIVVFQVLLRNIRDQHQEHFMHHFDDLMNKLRARLQQALRERYYLDQVLMEKDRLAKALADVRVLRRDLLDELGRSGQSLPIFHATSDA